MMTHYSVSEIAQAIHAEWVSKATEQESSIRHLVIDSRKLADTASSIFFALKSNRNDGHRYLAQVLEAGVKTVVVEHTDALPAHCDANVLVVKNSLEALQLLAAHHRGRFRLPVIGITGSNGKTIVKEWLNVLLADDFVIARSPRSYNSQIGVPLSVWGIEPIHTLGIFEAGISMPNEMNALQHIIQPQIGIITNLRDAHSEDFSSPEAKAEEKCRLFKECGKIIYPFDSIAISSALAADDFSFSEKIAWSFSSEEADWFVVKKVGVKDTELTFSHDGIATSFQLPFVDDASIENGITCIVTLFALGYVPAVIQDRLQRLTPLAMRLELIAGKNDSLLINDAYSCDLYSLEIALDFAQTNHSGLPLTLVLSDMLETGLPTDQIMQRISSLIASKKVSRLIGIGEHFHHHSFAWSVPITTYANTEEFLAHISIDSFQRQLVLIKGARTYRFERITELLQQQSHETILEVDLNALTHNLNYFKSLLSAPTKLMVMVKAFGYGSGSHEVSSLLQFNQVDYLAVAYTDEGVSLRNAGISLPIMVMNPEPGSYSALIRHKLEPEIFSRKSLELFLKTLRSSGLREAYPIHLKLDTGMHRLGFEEQDIEWLSNLLDGEISIQVASIFTHLTSTDNPQHDAFTQEQIATFEKWSKTLMEKLPYPVLRHCLNTGGIQRFPNAQFDMVRLGVGLYGVTAKEGDQHFLQSVGTFKTIISQIKHINAGESVGYNRNFFAPKNMTIATIPVGYADGLRRSLSNGKGRVWINGHFAPIVGNVCMDMTMVDITDIPCVEGDSVEVFGKNIPLHQLAAACDTIPYEILTSVSQRVRRVYLQE